MKFLDIVEHLMIFQKFSFEINNSIGNSLHTSPTESQERLSYFIKTYYDVSHIICTYPSLLYYKTFLVTLKIYNNTRKLLCTFSLESLTEATI